MAEVTDRETHVVSTPFGDPSGPYVLGTLRGRRVAFLARHGAGHRLLPSELNFRANIFGMKMLGVEYILSASAVGSLKEEYKPLDIVVPDQFIDRTMGRVSTFFGRGLAAHVGFAHPFCKTLSAVAVGSGRRVGATVHEGGTYVCMEGPQFSTLAESKLYRSWNADIIGMTNLQEAKLAREAEICYTTIALVTDYDCWHPDHDSVTVEMVIAVLTAERGDRAGHHRRRGGPAAVRAHVRMRQRAEVRADHASRCRARRDAAGAGADRRQVPVAQPTELTTTTVHRAGTQGVPSFGDLHDDRPFRRDRHRQRHRGRAGAGR